MIQLPPLEDAYQIMIVQYGSRRTTRSEVYLNYDLYGQPDAPVDMAYYFWVLQGAERTVLVDSGFSKAGGSSRARTMLMNPPELFPLAGVDAQSSGLQIVVTHGHYDHIGNLDRFPNATVFMARSEYEFWTGPHAGKTLFAHSAEPSEVDHLRTMREDGRLRLFDGELQLAPGIRVVEVGGHTPGQCVVFVDTTEGRTLLASDAIHYDEEFERDIIFSSTADLVKMYDFFAMARHLRDSGEIVHIVSGHDPATLAQFTPVGGPLQGLAATIGRPPAADPGRGGA